MKHSMKRRCFAHDYKGRAVYLVTLEVKGRARLLGKVRADGALDPRPGRELGEAEIESLNAGIFEPSELGARVSDEFMRIGGHVEGVRPLLAQAMPDHFHGILFVTRPIKRSLGSIVAGFKGKCSQIYRELTLAPPDRSSGGAPAALAPPNHRSGGAGVSPCAAPSLWEPGFHDRILTSRGQLSRMFRYVRDNPRRLALRMARPEFFTVYRELTLAPPDRSSGGAGAAHATHHPRFGGAGVSPCVFSAYGNPFLLDNPRIVQVQCSRKHCVFKRERNAAGELVPVRDAEGVAVIAAAAPEYRRKLEEMLDAAAEGAVLCSPCISDGERAIAYAALDAGASLIVLRREPFPPRFKPAGRFFEACAAGRLLMLYRELTLAPPDRSSGGAADTPRSPAALAPPDRSSGGAADTPRSPAALAPPDRSSGGAGASPSITRAECLELNATAAEICSVGG